MATKQCKQCGAGMKASLVVQEITSDGFAWRPYSKALDELRAERNEQRARRQKFPELGCLPVLALRLLRPRRSYSCSYCGAEEAPDARN